MKIGGRKEAFAAGVETALLVERVGEKFFPAQDDARCGVGLNQKSFSTLSGFLFTRDCSLSGRSKLCPTPLGVNSELLFRTYSLPGFACTAETSQCNPDRLAHSENNPNHARKVASRAEIDGYVNDCLVQCRTRKTTQRWVAKTERQPRPSGASRRCGGNALQMTASVLQREPSMWNPNGFLSSYASMTEYTLLFSREGVVFPAVVLERRKYMTEYQQAQQSAIKHGFKSYEAYLESPHWQSLKDRLGMHKCYSCGKDSKLLAHHIRYRDLLDVVPSDLVCLCFTCHDTFHIGCRKNGLRYIDVEADDIVAMINRFKLQAWYQRWIDRKERRKHESSKPKNRPEFKAIARRQFKAFMRSGAKRKSAEMFCSWLMSQYPDNPQP